MSQWERAHLTLLPYHNLTLSSIFSSTIDSFFHPPTFLATLPSNHAPYATYPFHHCLPIATPTFHLFLQPFPWDPTATC
ncbi:MAG: hypothetical protein Q9Q13_06075, partial [Acidobacteriota bacterium]|nr:hypothetical protein [Acidobacteriota bacterium]